MLIEMQFTKTPRFLALRNQNDDLDFLDSDMVPPGLQNEQEVGGAYVTVSQKGAAAAAQPPRAGGTDRDTRRPWNEVS